MKQSPHHIHFLLYRIRNKVVFSSNIIISHTHKKYHQHLWHIYRRNVDWGIRHKSLSDEQWNDTKILLINFHIENFNYNLIDPVWQCGTPIHATYRRDWWYYIMELLLIKSIPFCVGDFNESAFAKKKNPRDYHKFV